MCGRFAQIDSLEIVARKLHIDDILSEVYPSYNVAPGTRILAVTKSDGRRQLVDFSWGFIPRWSRDPSRTMINARSETAHEKPTFKDAFRKRRCLIPASGFFEWKKEASGKRPMYIRLRDRDLFTMAGIHETYVNSGGESLETCAILTTAAAEPIREIHDRMPVILSPGGGDTWLEPDAAGEDIHSLLVPTGEDLAWHAVSTRVNSPKNDDPNCIEPV